MAGHVEKRNPVIVYDEFSATDLSNVTEGLNATDGLDGMHMHEWDQLYDQNQLPPANIPEKVVLSSMYGALGAKELYDKNGVYMNRDARRKQQRSIKNAMKTTKNRR